MSVEAHPMAPHHPPGFITAPGDSDGLMIGVAIFLVVAVLGAGNFFLWLHSLPERLAHKGQKIQFELVAVLCLVALFTHIHAFWIAGLLLAFIDLPDFGKPLNRMAGAVEKIAGIETPPESAADASHGAHGHGGAALDEPAVQAVTSEAGTQPSKEAAILSPKGLVQADRRN